MNKIKKEKDALSYRVYSDNVFISLDDINVIYNATKALKCSVIHISLFIITTKDIGGACLFFKRAIFDLGEKEPFVFVFCHERVGRVLLNVFSENVFVFPIKSLSNKLDITLVYDIVCEKKRWSQTSLISFTNTEEQIINLRLNGNRYDEISVMLGVKLITVSVAIQKIMKKLCVKNDIEMLSKIMLIKDLKSGDM